MEYYECFATVLNPLTQRTCFSQVDMARGATLQHLETVQNSFEGLTELFEKETKSPGIKSCYDLEEIRTDGAFVLKACGEKNLVLLLRLPKKREVLVKTAGLGSEGGPEPESEPASGPEPAPEYEPEAEEAEAEAEAELDQEDAYYKWETAEYLEDLRSKLIMTDLPVEVEEEIADLRVMIEKFSEQLQVLSEMRDALFELFTSGHFAYQGGYQETHSFRLGGLPALTASLGGLTGKIAEWHTIQQSARVTFSV